MMQTPYIVDAIRAPMARGRAGGALADLHPVEILAHLLRTLVTRNRFDPGEVDDIIVGCVSQVGEQSNTPGRMAALAAGSSIPVPSPTVEPQCGSRQTAVPLAAQRERAGAYAPVTAPGHESQTKE